MSDSLSVSVIIPAYNIAPYIAESLASVFAQTRAPDEIVVVNDGSSDSAELERALQPFRSRINYIAQPNQGAAVARNTAIAASSGTLLAFLDGDDVWDPDFLASQLALLRDGGYDMVYANARLFGDRHRPGEVYMDRSPSSGTANLEGLLRLDCQPLTSTTVVKRQLVIDAGLFDPAIRRGQDFDLWVRLAMRGARIGYQRRPLGGYRIRSDSLSGLDEVKLIDREIAVYRALRPKVQALPGPLALVDEKLRRLTASREFAEGKAALGSADYSLAKEKFHAAWTSAKSMRLLAGRIGLAIAPGLLRRLYLSRHPG